MLRDAFPAKITRGYIAITVSVHHRGALPFSPFSGVRSLSSWDADPPLYASIFPRTGSNRRPPQRRPDSALRNDGVGGSNDLATESLVTAMFLIPTTGLLLDADETGSRSLVFRSGGMAFTDARCDLTHGLLDVLWQLLDQDF